MKYYIDYENTGWAGINGIANLSNEDEVDILYCKNETMPLGKIIDVMRSPAKINFIQVKRGTPNALDFQLVGRLFKEYDPEEQYCIISKDRGYDIILENEYVGSNSNIRRFDNISKSFNKAGDNNKKTDLELPFDNFDDRDPGYIKTGANKNRNKITVNKSEDNKESEHSAADNMKSEINSTGSAETDHNTEDHRKSEINSTDHAEYDHDTEDLKKSKINETDHIEQESIAAEQGIQDENSEGSASDSIDNELIVNQPDQPQEHLKTVDKKIQKSSLRPSKKETVQNIVFQKTNRSLTEDEVNKILGALKTVDEKKGKQNFYLYFVKQMGQTKGQKFYGEIKGAYSELVKQIRGL